MIVWCTLMLIFCKFANLPSVWQLMWGSRTKDASLGWQHTFKGDDDTSCISVDVKTAKTALRDICKPCQVNLKHIPVLILFRGCDPLLFWRCSHMMRPERMSSSRPSAFFCHPSLPYTFMHATFILYAQKFPDMQNISRQQPWRTGGFFSSGRLDDLLGEWYVLLQRQELFLFPFFNWTIVGFKETNPDMVGY